MTDTTPQQHDPLSLSILGHLASLDRKLDLMFEHLTSEVVDHRHQLRDIRAELGQLRDRLNSREQP